MSTATITNGKKPSNRRQPRITDNAPIVDESAVTDESVTAEVTVNSDMPDSTDNTVESDVTAESDNATEADKTDEATSSDESEKPQIVAIVNPDDLTGFTGQVRLAIAGADPTTGEVADVETIQAIRTIFGGLSVSAKKKALAWLDAGMKIALGGKTLEEMLKARAYLCVTTLVRATVTRPSIVVDPTDALVNRVASMIIAPMLIDPLIEADSDIAPDWRDRVNKLIHTLLGDVSTYQAYLVNVSNTAEGAETPTEPNVSGVVKDAARIATGRPKGAARATSTRNASTTASGTYNGPKRNVREHIRQAFAGRPTGTFLKVGEIAAFSSTEYGDAHPSGGAVSAALKSTNWDVAGIAPDYNGNGKFGARSN